MIVTETSIDGPPISREIWLSNMVEHIRQLRENGVPMAGLIGWPVFDQVDWDGALTHRIGKLHRVGLYTLQRQTDGSLRRTATPLADIYRDTAAAADFAHVADRITVREPATHRWGVQLSANSSTTTGEPTPPPTPTPTAASASAPSPAKTVSPSPINNIRPNTNSPLPVQAWKPNSVTEHRRDRHPSPSSSTPGGVRGGLTYSYPTPSVERDSILTQVIPHLETVRVF